MQLSLVSLLSTLALSTAFAAYTGTYCSNPGVGNCPPTIPGSSFKPVICSGCKPAAPFPIVLAGPCSQLKRKVADLLRPLPSNSRLRIVNSKPRKQGDRLHPRHLRCGLSGTSKSRHRCFSSPNNRSLDIASSSAREQSIFFLFTGSTCYCADGACLYPSL